MNTLEYARHRRLRHTAPLRSLVRENQLHKSDLIYPIFVAEGEDIKREVSSMPGVFNLSLDHLTAEKSSHSESNLSSYSVSRTTT